MECRIDAALVRSARALMHILPRTMNAELPNILFSSTLETAASAADPAQEFAIAPHLNSCHLLLWKRGAVKIDVEGLDLAIAHFENFGDMTLEGSATRCLKVVSG